jgi:DNA-binding CsgD family transcriptional regulator
MASAFCRSAGAEEGGVLTARQRRYCLEVAKGTPVGQAAKVAGVSERTGRNWRKRAEIEVAIRAAQSESMALGRAVLVSGVAQAARGLVCMASGDEPAESARVAACRAVLDAATALTDLADVEQRLTQLEDAEGNKQP